MAFYSSSLEVWAQKLGGGLPWWSSGLISSLRIHATGHPKPCATTTGPMHCNKRSDYSWEAHVPQLETGPHFLQLESLGASMKTQAQPINQIANLQEETKRLWQPLSLPFTGAFFILPLLAFLIRMSKEGFLPFYRNEVIFLQDLNSLYMKFCFLKT